MSEVLLTFALAVALAWLLGLHMARALADSPTRIDRYFAPIERLLCLLTGADAARGMSWRGYAKWRSLTVCAV